MVESSHIEVEGKFQVETLTGKTFNDLTCTMQFIFSDLGHVPQQPPHQLTRLYSNLVSESLILYFTEEHCRAIVYTGSDEYAEVKFAQYFPSSASFAVFGASATFECDRINNSLWLDPSQKSEYPPNFAESSQKRSRGWTRNVSRFSGRLNSIEI